MLEIKTEITINSSKKDVWRVLTDFDKYPEWNPFIQAINGKAEKNNRIRTILKLKNRKPAAINPVVRDVIEETKFEWFGKGPLGMFNGRHYFILEEKKKNEVQFIHGEFFSGWFMKPVMKKIGESTKEAFIEMNKALKTRVECISSL